MPLYNLSMRIFSFRINTLATIMPTGESCPITCEAVGLRYCKDELNRMKFPNSPAVATANKINQRGLRNTRNGGNLFFTARMAPRPILAIKKR